MSLELYEQFAQQSSVESCKEEGDAVGAYRPMIVDRLLRHLERIAATGDIDGWMDYIDPELTYDENKAKLTRKAGAEGHDTPFKCDRDAYVSKMLAKQEEYEQRMKEERDSQRAREEMYRNSMR
ncbi:hypothetical protein [Halapricum desulfuricans]|nr:hypothetical protein [Halapricum desulfuricans]